jgi:hypothetical protein
MSNPSCDGDAVTLQALCDSLKITVRIVKLIDADMRQAELLLASSSRERLHCCHDYSGGRETSSLILDDDSFCSEGSDTSSYASAVSRVSSDTLESGFPYTIPAYASILVQEKGSHKRLYITHDIEPRNLIHVDEENKKFAHFSQGRLIWLSHIGDEAHYRLLRLKDICDSHDPSVFNRDEELAASESRVMRLLKLQASNQYIGFDCGMRVPKDPIPIPCMKVGATSSHVDMERCSLCLKTLYVDSYELFESKSCISRPFCNMRCVSIWSAVDMRNLKKRVINCVDDCPVANQDRALKPKHVRPNRDVQSIHTNRSEIFQKLRPRPSRMNLQQTPSLRGGEKRLPKPVDRFVADM